MSQEYELKIGVHHIPSLKTTQLIQFLQNQSNDFLANELPQHLVINEGFATSLTTLGEGSVDYNELVGIIILYSTASMESFNYARTKIPPAEQLTDLFMLFVEMDNTEKKLNVIGDEGERLCDELGLLFIRLSLYNSEDLLTNLNRSLYYLIENYYYPNEEDKQNKTENSAVIAVKQTKIDPKKDSRGQSRDEYVIQYDSPNKALATKEEKHKITTLLERAASLRENREQEMVKEQSAIDQSIENVEKVLNNINSHIQDKLQSEWFTSLKDSLYKPIDKRSAVFSKIKLTQQFLDETPASRLEYYPTGKYSSIIPVTKRSENPLMRLLFMLGEGHSVELDVYESSTYEELASIALRKLGLKETERNTQYVRDKVRLRIQGYVKELSRAVKQTERQRVYERSYLAVGKK